MATIRLAQLLGVKRGTPLLRIDQVDYDPLGQAVMLSDEWHVSDAFELIVNRRALPSADDTDPGPGSIVRNFLVSAAPTIRSKPHSVSNVREGSRAFFVLIAKGTSSDV